MQTQMPQQVRRGGGGGWRGGLGAATGLAAKGALQLLLIASVLSTAAASGEPIVPALPVPRPHARVAALGPMPDAFSAPASILGQCLRVELDSKAQVSVMPHAQYLLLPERLRGTINTTDTPDVADFTGTPRPGLAMGWVKLPVDINASITKKGEIVPTLLIGQQMVNFLVVAEGHHVLLGSPDIMLANSVLHDLFQAITTMSTITYEALLGPITSLNEAGKLGSQHVHQTTQVVYDPPGDPAAPAFPHDFPGTTSTTSGGFVPRSLDSFLNGPELKDCAWPELRAVAADYLFANQEQLFGPFLKVSKFPKVNISVVHGPPITEGINRMCPPFKYEKAMQAHETLDAAGITAPCERSDIDHINAFVYVQTGTDGKIRLTLDARGINGRVARKEVIMPDLATFYNTMDGCSVFSDLDWRQFFHTFQLDEESQRLFGFRYPNGAWGRYLALIMGLHNAPAIAQELAGLHVVTPLTERFGDTTVVVGGVPRPQHSIRTYVDNSTVATRGATRPAEGSVEELELAKRHWYNAIIPFFEASMAWGLKFKEGGFTLLKRVSTALGVVCDGVTVKMDPRRAEGFATMTAPANPGLPWVMKARGLMTYYNRFVGTLPFAQGLQALTDIIVTANQEGTRVATLWTAAHTQLWEDMKKAVINAAATYVPQPGQADLPTVRRGLGRGLGRDGLPVPGQRDRGADSLQLSRLEQDAAGLPRQGGRVLRHRHGAAPSARPQPADRRHRADGPREPAAPRQLEGPVATALVLRAPEFWQRVLPARARNHQHAGGLPVAHGDNTDGGLD
jgi:hypothetical protein